MILDSVFSSDFAPDKLNIKKLYILLLSLFDDVELIKLNNLNIELINIFIIS